MVARRGAPEYRFPHIFLLAKGKRLEHTLEHTYHRQIYGQIFSAFFLTSPTGGCSLQNLIEAQQLRFLASRPVQVLPSWTYS